MEERRGCVGILEKHLNGEEDMAKKFITVKRFAEILNMDHQTIRRKIKAGEIPAYKIGGKVLLKREEIDKWIESQKIEVRN